MVLTCEAPGNPIVMARTSDSGHEEVMQTFTAGSISLHSVDGCMVLIEVESSDSHRWEFGYYDALLVFRKTWWGGERPVVSRATVNGHDTRLDALWKMLAKDDPRFVLIEDKYDSNKGLEGTGDPRTARQPPQP